MAQELCHLFNIVLNSETVPDEFRKDMIVRLPKRRSKQLQQLAKDYAAISPWTVLCSILLNRLKDDLDKRL